MFFCKEDPTIERVVTWSQFLSRKSFDKVGKIYNTIINTENDQY